MTYGGLQTVFRCIPATFWNELWIRVSSCVFPEVQIQPNTPNALCSVVIILSFQDWCDHFPACHCAIFKRISGFWIQENSLWLCLHGPRCPGYDWIVEVSHFCVDACKHFGPISDMYASWPDFRHQDKSLPQFWENWLCYPQYSVWHFYLCRCNFSHVIYQKTNMVAGTRASHLPINKETKFCLRVGAELDISHSCLIFLWFINHNCLCCKQ